MAFKKLFNDTRQSKPEADPRSTVTEEVGGEGGSPGDLELEEQHLPLRGSEGSETVRSGTEVREIRRDETGRGRRP